jgi:ketoreductase
VSDLEGRVAVVTGAGTGIGRATALRLSRLGAKVALLGRTPASLEKVAAEARGERLALAADVRDAASVGAAFERVAERFGPVHAVVANAGVGGPNEPGPHDRWDEIVRTNLDGTYHTIRAFERVMAPGPEPRHVVVISSCLARFGVAGLTAYCASKTGLLGLVRALAVEWGAHQVLVNAICPGWVDTEMARRSMQNIADTGGTSYEAARHDSLAAVPLQRISEPDEIAGLVAFLLSPDARGITGQTLDANNGAWM